MSEENVELVRRLLDIFAKRDHEAVFAFYDPEIEWDTTNLPGAPPAMFDLAGVYRATRGADPQSAPVGAAQRDRHRDARIRAGVHH
jgi:ketosteroid isomerase-like protein